MTFPNNTDNNTNNDNSSSSLGNIRTKIDAIDEKVASLIAERLDITRDIGRYKAAHGLPVKNEQREAEVLDHVADIAGPENERIIRSLYTMLMNLTCEEEEKV